jgi:pSer/pThr/pTyr-binding forkhead associated (FHA) protein
MEPQPIEGSMAETGSGRNHRRYSGTILFVAQGDPIGAFIEIADPPSIVGRAEGCELRIHDVMVSKLHCRVWFDGSACWVEDIGSTNGTFVNARRVSVSALRDGDNLTLGMSRVRCLKLERAAREVMLLSRPPCMSGRHAPADTDDSD